MTSLGVALVTGASQGIGRAIALRLAKDGFDIAINDIPSSKAKLESLSKEITEKGRKVCTAVGDVSSEDAVKNMISTVVKDLGGLDVLVANAGICITKPLIDSTVDEWTRLFNVNVLGEFLCYKYAAQQMIKQGRGGRIIGASSVAGQQGEPGIGAYSATKFAIRGMTQVAAKEWGQHKITVNTYCPGAIETEMLENIGKDLVSSVKEFYEMQSKTSPLGYNGKPEDIASIVSYLASKEAHWITGQSIAVNGGRLTL
ncbi:Diacetyl reductase [(S)-acetoin forming] [Hypsizygus marmoreus]|uniref:Diacetyl reductase [(S)-acetoin forming] n=1 Tax=Hypsizygus marmoreus TaxID=39966 RepID=A0A369K960_HYPMA|nr:Diacetyl reductase [(S)-acetoin forming] [Hypsizygus marmoreus]